MSQASNHQWVQTFHFYSNPNSSWFKHIFTKIKSSFLISILHQERLRIVRGACYYKLNVRKPPTSLWILYKVILYFEVLMRWRHAQPPRLHKPPCSPLASASCSGRPSSLLPGSPWLCPTPHDSRNSSHTWSRPLTNQPWPLIKAGFTEDEETTTDLYLENVQTFALSTEVKLHTLSSEEEVTEATVDYHSLPTENFWSEDWSKELRSKEDVIAGFSKKPMTEAPDEPSIFMGSNKSSSVFCFFQKMKQILH